MRIFLLIQMIGNRILVMMLPDGSHKVDCYHRTCVDILHSSETVFMNQLQRCSCSITSSQMIILVLPLPESVLLRTVLTSSIRVYWIYKVLFRPL